MEKETKDIKEVLESYGIKSYDIIKELNDNGNPLSNNKLFLVLDKKNNKKYVLKSSYADYKKKKIEHDLLLFLSKNNIPVILPVINKDKKSIVNKDKIYELFPFIENSTSKIDTKNIEDSEQLSNLLFMIHNIDTKEIIEKDMEKISSRQITEQQLRVIRDTVFSNADNKNIADFVNEAYFFLEKEFFPYLPYLEKKFSHGDLHPNNIIWKEGKIEAVIDWDIAGIRNELFDLAFLIGCIGIDNPMELTRPFVRNLIESFTKKAKPKLLSLELVVELIIAIRMNWLIVWLSNKKDNDILNMEIEFISTLIENADLLKESWKKISSFSKNSTIIHGQLSDEIRKSAEQAIKEKIIDNIIVFNSKTIEKYGVEKISTDLRKLAMYYGTRDEIKGLINAIIAIEKIYSFNEYNKHVVSELAFVYANASLDFTRTYMKNALELLIEKNRKLIETHDFIEIKIAHSFILRNYSILLGEIKEYEKAFKIIDMLSEFSEKNDNIEIKEELSRAIYNGIITAKKANNKSMAHYLCSKLKAIKDEEETDKIRESYFASERFCE